MTDNKHQAVWDWLYSCPAVKDLFFNFGVAQNDNTIVGTQAAESIIKTYLGGATVREYDFAIIQFKPANTETPNSAENAEILFDTEAVMRWVDEQAKQRNFPAFPANCEIQSIKNLHNMPFVAGQDETGAKYMFTVRITYLEKRG